MHTHITHLSASSRSRLLGAGLATILSLGIACGGDAGDGRSATAPTAVINSPATIYELQNVSLDGRDSTDDGRIASYQWRQLAGPNVTLSGAETSQASFTAPMTATAQVVSFELTVTDDSGETATTTTDITLARSAFVVYVQGDSETTGEALWVTDRLGNNRRLSPPPEPGLRMHGFYISPDHRRVAFLRYRSDGRLALWLVNIDGTNLRDITSADDRVYRNGMSWSPDSRYLAFIALPSSQDRHSELYVIGAEQDTPQAVSAVGTTDDLDNVAAANGDVANLRVPDGIPDAARLNPSGIPYGRVLTVAWSVRNVLAFVAEVHDGRPEVFTVNADGSQLTQVFDIFQDNDGAPGFDFDGGDADTSPDVWVATASNRPTWSPDGLTLAFALSPGPSADIGGHVFTMGIENEHPTLRLVSNLRDLPAPRAVSRLFFSPDSAYLLVVADRDREGQNELFSQSLASGIVRKVGRADLDFYPADGVSDTGYAGGVNYITRWIDDQRFVFSGDLRRDGIVELYVGRVDFEPTTPADIIVLTDIFAVDWDGDDEPDFDPNTPDDKPTTGWQWPYPSAVDGNKVIVGAALANPGTEEIYAIAADGSQKQRLYSMPLGMSLDDFERANPSHSMATQYLSVPGVGSFYETVLVPHAGGPAVSVLNLYRDEDGDGVGDFDSDNDGYPDYSVSRARCADAECNQVLVVVRNVDGDDGFVVLTEPASGAVTHLGDVDVLRNTRLIAPNGLD